MLPIIMLGLLAIPLALTYSVTQRCKHGRLRAIDLGVVVVWIAFLYSFTPLMGIWLASLDVGVLADNRLGDDVPDMDSVLIVATSYAAFMLAFAISYSTARRADCGRLVTWQVTPSFALRRLVWLMIVIKLALFGMGLGFAADVGDDYGSSYLAFLGQPVWILQLVNMLRMMDIAVMVLVIVVACSLAPMHRILAAALVVLQIVIAIAWGGSRTSAVLSAFAYMVAWSIYGRGFKVGTLASFAGLGVAGFLIVGQLRDNLLTGDESVFLQLFQSGEFLAVFVNSLDLLERAGDKDLEMIRGNLYFVDLLRIIPQQIVGDLKFDPAVFYVRNYYPEYFDLGGGLAFGTIAESTVGFGWPEALIRGGLLGVIYALVANHCLSGRITIIRAFVYVWFVIMAYQSIRDTTFSTIPRFITQVIPLLILIGMTGMLRTPKMASPTANAQG